MENILAKNIDKIFYDKRSYLDYLYDLNKEIKNKLEKIKKELDQKIKVITIETLRDIINVKNIEDYESYYRYLFVKECLMIKIKMVSLYMKDTDFKNGIKGSL
ncbi:hypothetical protein [Acholeplasma hippikon]|uniref:Uncharacterized protein n=1 Tax=Acholeplasma hippikon TaxID=264636 RepID=A0A449BL11_9MOLU|nr:hypothetical protein [Acholeplasma hippikon]VEU83161.1 Uncharacterised protein [Acholeplasma hippikon]